MRFTRRTESASAIVVSTEPTEEVNEQMEEEEDGVQKRKKEEEEGVQKRKKTKDESRLEELEEMVESVRIKLGKPCGKHYFQLQPSDRLSIDFISNLN